jgi:hypothetical protein
MKNITFFLAALILFLGSCTIQKRVYRPGFTVEWKGDKFQKSNEDVAQEEVVVEDIAHTVIENATTTATPLNKNKVAPTESTGQPTKASNNLKTQEEKVSVEKLQKVVDSRAENAPSYQMKKAAKYSKGATLEHKASIAADDEGNGALKGIGWVFIIIGILILVFASILVGILLMLVGLLFFVVGKNN